MHHEQRGQAGEIPPPSLYCAFLHSLSLCCACACFPCWASFRLIMGEWRRYGRRSIVDVTWMPSIDAIWSSGHLIIPRPLWDTATFLRDFYGGLNLTWDLRRDCVDINSYVSSTRRLRSEDEIHLRFWDSPNLDETERGMVVAILRIPRNLMETNWNFAWKQKCCLLCIVRYLLPIFQKVPSETWLYFERFAHFRY